MTYSQMFQSGHLVLPSDLLFHFHELFPSADDYLVWQFFFFQNTSSLESLAPSQIAQALGKTVAEVNRSIESLQAAGLLDYKTIHLAGEIELIFDARPALEKLDGVLGGEAISTSPALTGENEFKDLVADFERELGRLLSPFELEDLQQTLQKDKVSADLVRTALKEAVFNNKTNWKYIQAILRNWRREGISTPAQVAAKQAEREQVVSPDTQLSADFLGAMDMWKE